MSLITILIAAILVSVAFHFVGVYTGAKKTVWLMLAIMWAASIGMAMSEIKPKGYEEVEKMQGKFADTDELIEAAKPEISIYELITIKKSYTINKKNEQK